MLDNHGALVSSPSNGSSVVPTTCHSRKALVLLIVPVRLLRADSAGCFPELGAELVASGCGYPDLGPLSCHVENVVEGA